MHMVDQAWVVWIINRVVSQESIVISQNFLLRSLKIYDPVAAMWRDLYLITFKTYNYEKACTTPQ